MTSSVVYLYGLGNIGFRHLQGLAPLAGEIRLVGVDPSPEARVRAGGEWRGDGRFLDPGEVTADEADVVILATSARGRLALLEQSLRAHRPRAVVLEKVAFQTVEAFDEAGRLVEAAGAAAWVNCPRRQWPLHQALKARLAGRGTFHLAQGGPDWGLACNAVHFIDLLQFLTGQAEVEGQGAAIDALIPSKRPGFSEVRGELRFACDGGAMSLSCRPDDQAGLVVSGDGWRWRVEETAGRVTDEATGEVLIEAGRMPYQSELGAALVRPLLRREAPGIAGLAESRAAHAALIDLLKPAFLAADVDMSQGLPIT